MLIGQLKQGMGPKLVLRPWDTSRFLVIGVVLSFFIVIIFFEFLTSLFHIQCISSSQDRRKWYDFSGMVRKVSFYSFFLPGVKKGKGVFLF
jgi:hypothetical protein